MKEMKPGRRITVARKVDAAGRLTTRRARSIVIEEAVALYQEDGFGGGLPARLRRAVHDLVIARLRVIGGNACRAEAGRKDGE